MSFSDDQPLFGRKPLPRSKALPSSRQADNVMKLGHGLLLTALALSALSVGAIAFVLPGAPPALLVAAALLQTDWFVAGVAVLFPLSAFLYLTGRSEERSRR